MRAFGVGCISFEYVRMAEMSPAEKFGIRTSSFKSDLQEALTNVQGITNLKISEDFFLDPFVTRFRNEDLLHLSSFRDENFNLGLRHGSITFKINIPTAQQDKTWIRGKNIGENFKVTFDFSQIMPLVFVEMLDMGTPSPSLAVIILREYLRTSLLKSGSEISLSMLGPTPFHCDFWVGHITNPEQVEADPKNGNSFFIIEKQLRSRGYDDIYYLWHPSVNIFNELIAEIFRNDLNQQLSLFYRIVSSRNFRRSLDNRIISSVETLAKSSLKKGLLSWVKRVLWSGHRIRRLIVEVLQLKLVTVKHQKDFEKVLEGLSESDISNSIGEKIEKELSHDFAGALRETNDLALALQSSRTQEMTNFLVVFSVLVATLASILFH